MLSPSCAACFVLFAERSALKTCSRLFHSVADALAVNFFMAHPAGGGQLLKQKQETKTRTKEEFWRDAETSGGLLTSRVTFLAFAYVTAATEARAPGRCLVVVRLDADGRGEELAGKRQQYGFLHRGAPALEHQHSVCVNRVEYGTPFSPAFGCSTFPPEVSSSCLSACDVLLQRCVTAGRSSNDYL